MKSLLLVPLLLCLNIGAFAQSHRSLNLIERTNYFLIGGNIGIAYHSGGYANQSPSKIDISAARPALTGYLQTKISKRWHIRAQGSLMMLTAKDKRPNLETTGQKAFETILFDFSPLFVYDLGVNKRNRKRSPYSRKKGSLFTWYLVGGTGLFVANVKNYVGGTSANKVGGTLNGGLGFRYTISENWLLNAEALGRMSTSNDLDGLKAQALPVDLYLTGQIGIAYRIPGMRIMR
ncbi:outer membrane beta-barrel protein [Flammeovirga aprica]|uniref:Outer membrane beta-barrel protein n=1 Tax=Flammeovirga aprica JL-4 TaxID=694437 RepID=A0A7X9P1H5_9BACT|nr:outer membrane beta-barrel protein [Flammeovirga aprica]NME67778.1 outer membrane beta-barrel protein [Flammeovirga aprica JL-4]